MMNKEILDDCLRTFRQTVEAQTLMTYRSRSERLTFDERFAIIKAIENSFAPAFLEMRADSRNLSDSDLLCCALSAEGFDNLVISEVLTISKDSVRMRKTRIREKLSPEWSGAFFGEQKRNLDECCGKVADVASATAEGTITLSQKEYDKLLKRKKMKPSMTFKQAVANGFKNYGRFTGRATRSEFWFFMLALYIMEILLVVLNFIAAVPLIIRDEEVTFLMGLPFLVVDFGVAVALFIPALSVSVRRLHDSDRSGRWIWLAIASTLCLAIVPTLTGLSHRLWENMDSVVAALVVCFAIFYLVWLAASIYIIVLFCQPGTEGPNNYGADPRSI